MFSGISLDPIRIIGVMIGFIIGVTVHEFMHAYTAVMLGDDSPRRAGRITLNPAAHFDPFGFFMFILLALNIGFFAWGRPVMVNPYALRGGRKGMALVAIAGPLSNVVVGTLFAIPFRLGLDHYGPPEFAMVLQWIIYVNFLMFAFNLIPLPPLDGFTVLTGVLSTHWALILEPIRRYGPAIFLALIFLPQFLHLNLIGPMIQPWLTLLFTTIVGTQM